MATVTLQVLGVLAFLVMTVVLGRAIRATPTLEAAQRLSRVSHAFFWGALVAPMYLGLVWPGFWKFDELLGLPPLPFVVARWVVGVPLALVGLWLSSAAMRALKQLGQGQMAFKLTRQVVSARVYEWTRNPMSLGAYLQWLALGLLTGSTYLLAMGTLGWIPVHLFNLVYFEELELRARHGEAYAEYQRRVPFLLPAFGRAPA